jgi:hypothetical protein
MVKLSVEKCAIIPINDYELLLDSVKNGNLDIFNFLINNGAKYQDNINDLFSYSLGQTHLELVKFFINKGVDIHNNNDI